VAIQTISLQIYLERIIEEHDRIYTLRFDDAQRAVNAALAAQQKSTADAFTASEKAIIKAEVATEKRFESVNEFRATLSDLQLTYMSRLEATALFKAIDEKLVVMQTNNEARLEVLRMNIEKNSESINKDVSGLRESRSESSGKTAGANALWGYLIAIAAIVMAVVFHFVK
jgi:hypothetical protein